MPKFANRAEEIEFMLNWLLEMEDELSYWGKEFINSLSDLDEDQQLSTRQYDKLKELYEDNT